MRARATVLGAGFGGLELSTILSESLGDEIEVTLIDSSDAFVFGYSKLDVMFGGNSVDTVRLPYRNFVKPGARFLRETVTAIDPITRRVTTDAAVYDCDYLVVALGTDYDLAATPGLAEGGNEFYSLEGADRLRRTLPSFSKGNAIIGVAAAPYKCPPAPSECALLLHDFLTTSGVRGACEITMVLPAKPCAAVPRDLKGPDCRLRRTRHQVHAEPARGLARSGSPSRRPRRGRRASLRPLSRRAKTSRARGSGSERSR